jgi:hypothetical protein
MFDREDSMENAWKETLDSGHVLLIDGGMGPELQRRGVPMDKVAWSAFQKQKGYSSWYVAVSVWMSTH